MAQRPQFRTDLEGLRGIAILLVVLFHAGVPMFAGSFVGVDVFFVLSGYFITLNLLREQQDTGGIDLTNFYGRRALRVLPALLLVLLVTLGLVMWLYAPIDRADIAENARAVAMGSGNIAFASGSVNYFNSGENPLLHTWSLAVEQQFYFVWPLVLLLVAYVARRRADWSEHSPGNGAFIAGFAVAGVASFIASLWLTKTAQPWAFFSMPTRIWEFALGGIIAAWLPSHPSRTRAVATLLQLGGLAAIAFALWRYDSATPYPGVAALLPALAAVALIVGGQADPSAAPQDDTVVALSEAKGLLHAALSARPLQWLGRHSYAWYLWHWPLIGLGAVLTPSITPTGKLAWAVAGLALAWLTHRFVEGSAHNGRLASIRTEWLAPAALAASLIVVLIAHGAFGVAKRQASSPEQKVFAAARNDRMRHDCWATTIDEWSGPCALGDTSSSTTIALLGDSHAEHWLGALDRIGRERHWKIVALVKGGCPVTEMPELRGTTREKHYFECARYREAMVQRIIAMKPAAAILSSWDHYVPVNGSSSMWQVTPELWERGLRRTYQRLTSAGVHTVAIRGTPRTWFDVPACLSRRAANLPLAGSCDYDRSLALPTVARNAQTRAARGLPVAFVDMNDQICPTQRCGVVRNGAIVFTDDNHLTASFSRSMAPVLSQRLDVAFTALGTQLR